MGVGVGVMGGKLRPGAIEVDEGFLNHTRKDLIAFGMVAAISQNGWNRQLSTAFRPPNEAGKAIRAAECQGQTQKRKSRLLRCVLNGPLQTSSIAPGRSFPPATPGSVWNIPFRGDMQKTPACPDGGGDQRDPAR